MKSLEAIREENIEAATRARRTGVLKKLTVVKPGFDRTTVRGIKHIGDAEVDVDLEDVDNRFVDSSGFGRPNERALTQEQFLSRLETLVQEHGPLAIAIVSEGQFQVYVRVWKSNEKVARAR